MTSNLCSNGNGHIATPDQALELASAGAYALVMPLVGLEEEDFWRPIPTGR
jgi:hypothetical protein